MVTVKNHLNRASIKEYKPLNRAGFEYPGEGKNYFLY